MLSSLSYIRVNIVEKHTCGCRMLSSRPVVFNLGYAYPREAMETVK
jgi:hypothetical protein